MQSEIDRRILYDLIGVKIGGDGDYKAYDTESNDDDDSDEAPLFLEQLNTVADEGDQMQGEALLAGADEQAYRKNDHIWSVNG